MAVVTRYFSTSGAGAADGTTWADRAALFSAGNWSTVITGFDFSGSDSLECLIEGGLSYTCGQSLASGLFANPPTAANPLLLAGCNSSGVLLTVPDPDWVSAQPAWSTSTLPTIATTTNVATVNLATCGLYLLNFTASGTTTNPIVSATAWINWCQFAHSGSNTSAQALASGSAKISNSVVSMSGSSFSAGINWTNGLIQNCRVVGVMGSSGNRHGIVATGSANGTPVSNCTIISCGGDGIGNASATTTHIMNVYQNTIANCGGAGIKGNATASQTGYHALVRNMVTGCGAYGIDGQSAARCFVSGNRLRDNTSGNITGLGNYPTDLNNYTTDSDDATEYVDTATGDYRIKYGSAIWGQGYGAGDEPAPTGGGGIPIFGGNIIRVPRS